MKGGKIVTDEGAETLPEKAHRVLQAAAVEAYGMPGAYVSHDAVMQRVSISDPEEFRAIAEYLEGRGWIAEADPHYRVFIITDAGIDAVTR